MHIRPAASASPLIAVLTMIVLELLRASGPLIDASPGGPAGKALVALAVFTAPVLAWPITAALRGRSVAAPVATLIAARLALQAFPTPPPAAGLAAAAIGMITLVLAVARAEGGAATIGLLCGVALDVALRSLSATWDVVWQPGWVPWLVTAAECGAAAAAARWTLRRPGTDRPCGPHAWVVGPFLGLCVLFLANPAFVASQAGLTTPTASGALILGALFAVVVAGEVRHAPERHARYAGLAAAPAAGGAVAAALLTSGRHVAILVIAAQLAAGVLLARGLSATPSRNGVRAAGLGAGLGFLLTVLPYQAYYETPLWVPNGFWPLASVAALAVAASRRVPVAPPRPLAHEFRLAGACAIALLAPVVALVATPSPVTEQPSRGRLKLLSWNVHYGVSGAAAVSPEAVARVIEHSGADVVMLQEVSRGWPVGGGLDLAEWLSRRLRLRYVWAPGADGQLGNVILSRIPLRDARAGVLPHGREPIRHSYAAATVAVPGAGELRLMTTHLRDRAENAPARPEQIDALLKAWGGGRPAVIAGDLDLRPSRDTGRGKGFLSAQDATGHGSEPTTDRPRIDRIWGSDGVVFSDFSIMREATVSGRFPLKVTIAPAT